MREYQEKYIENLKEIIELNRISSEVPADAAAFLEERRQKIVRIRKIIIENTAMLRQSLFPLLDDIVSANEEEIKNLEDFAASLVSGVSQLDLLLNYSIHNALVVYARKWGKRDLLIKELYHTGMALFYMQDIIDRAGKNRYRWKMGMVFGEAASYIKQYDEIKDPQIRGFIHRSMANLALSYKGINIEEGQQKLKVIRRSLQILEDPAYHEKTPSLPWDLFIFKSHQERTTAIGLLRAGIHDSDIIREVMESAEYVRERQLENSRKKGIKPILRWQMVYESAQYHCGVQPFSYLLHWMEKVYMERDESDFSEEGIYCNIFIPALYAEYVSKQGYQAKKKMVLNHMYRRIVAYVSSMSNNQMDEKMLRSLFACLQSFIEYPDGIKQKDFLLKLIVCRNPDAYVVLRMAAQISKMTAAAAFEKQPEILLGILGCKTVEDLHACKKEILQFVYESGMLHDVGMLTFNNMVRRIGRSWMEEEKEMYQYHVYAGQHVLARCASTHPYALTALGHHRFYNEKGGYPEEYTRKENPNQAATDIVSAAAFLVRLMDDITYVNRESMTLTQALNRMQKKDAGTRLSPAVVSLLADMQPELERYLADGKVKAYEEAFQLLKGKDK